MNLSQTTCQAELDENNLIPRKYYGQVFTTDPNVIQKMIETIKSVHKPGSKIVEIGAGLGYISEALLEHFGHVDLVEFDKSLFEALNKKLVHSKNLTYIKEKSDNLNKYFIHNSYSETGSGENAKNIKNTKINSTSVIRLINADILEYNPPEEDYLLVGNIPFHISGKLYRKFMSEEDHKPYGMIFITDKQYASTLMGQPPRCYRVSLQAQSYGNIEIVSDVPPTSVYPEPKVMSCIMKIMQNDTQIPKNFWKVVNYHWENFPTKEVESPKAMGLKRWLELSKGQF